MSHRVPTETIPRKQMVFPTTDTTQPTTEGREREKNATGLSESLLASVAMTMEKHIVETLSLSKK